MVDKKVSLCQVSTTLNVRYLYQCLREERRLRVFQNRVLRGIFGLRRDEITEEWRKLPNEELNDLYCSPSIV